MPAFRCGVCEAFNRLSDAAAKNCRACELKLDVTGWPQEVDGAALGRAIALSPVPLLVHFWEAWCGPCLLSTPVVASVARKLAGEVTVLAMEVRSQPEAADAYAVYAIPTFTVFRSGEEKARKVGFMPGSELERWVRGLVSPRLLDTRV